MDDIEIIHILKKDLKSAISNNTYWKEENVIFPKSKALWIISSPRIDDDDICAIVAKEKNEIVVLIYLMPDIAQTSTTNNEKIYWLLHWWVVPKYDGNVLSTYLFNEALRVANKKVLVKSYAENASDFYNKMPFEIINSRLRYTLFFSLDSSILFGRYPFLKSFKYPIKLIDRFSAQIFRIINTSKITSRTKNLNYEYVNEIDDPTWDEIKPLCSSDLILKTKAYLNWQISKVQYTKAPLDHKIPYKSIENGTSKNIEIFNIRITKKNQFIGFLSFLINHNELNVKYFLVKEDKFYEQCADVLMHHLITLKQNFMFIDDDELVKYISARYKTVFIHKVNKNALSHHNLVLENQETISIKNHDGHFY